MADLNFEFSKRLKQLIDAEFGGNQTKLAEKIQIHKNSIGKYLKGSVPEWQILAKICGLFKVDMDWLVLGSKSPNHVTYGGLTETQSTYDPGETDLVSMTSEVLQSNSHWAHSLKSLIPSIYSSYLHEKNDRRTKSIKSKIPKTGDRRKFGG